MLILSLDPVFDGQGEQEQQSHYIAILWVINIRFPLNRFLGGMPHSSTLSSGLETLCTFITAHSTVTFSLSVFMAMF